MFTLNKQLENDTILLGDLPLCQVLLMNNSSIPWLILVPKRTGIQEIYELNATERTQLSTESAKTGELLMQEFAGHKLNIGALGNIVSQLHIHHIVRFTHDPAWPKPVWGNLAAKPYTALQVKQTRKRLNKRLHDAQIGYVEAR